MARYIDAVNCADTISERFNIPLADLVDVFAEIPTADVVEVKNGEWIQGIPYRCSNCGKPAPEEKNTSEEYSCWLSDYCPHCGVKMGAKMDGGKI